MTSDTNPVPAPTPADLGRDLAADLAECERRCGKGWVLWVCDNADPGWPAAIRRALAAESRVDELRRGFDLRWKATQRAIARWRAEDPAGRALEQPDHADLCCWLMDRLTTAEAECERLRAEAADVLAELVAVEGHHVATDRVFRLALKRLRALTEDTPNG